MSFISDKSYFNWHFIYSLVAKKINKVYLENIGGTSLLCFSVSLMFTLIFTQTQHRTNFYCNSRMRQTPVVEYFCSNEAYAPPSANSHVSEQ